MLTHKEQADRLLGLGLGRLARELEAGRDRDRWRGALIRVLQARTALRAELLRAELLVMGRPELAAVAAAPPAALVLPELQARRRARRG